ncbi:MAG: glycosyltransferase [Nannocystales bacterium]
MTTPIVTSLAIVAAASAAVTALSHACVHLRLRKRRLRMDRSCPGVSVLKPLKGIDEGLRENLRSLAMQAYAGRFELILGAANVDDPALDIALEVRRAFPSVSIKLVAGREGTGLNPKVRLLEVLSDVAMHDTILISDSNVPVAPNYLSTLVAEMDDPAVGLVSSMLAGDGERTVAAGLENLHLNSFVAGAVCGADVLAGHPCVVGKSMLMRRSDLAALGGWDLVRNVLGEDYVLGVAFRRAGHRVALSPHVVRTINGGWGLSRFVSRHLRWGQMRRWISPTAYCFEPLLNPVPPALAVIAVHGWRSSGSMALVWWAVLSVLFKLGSDAVLSYRLRGRWPDPLDLMLVPLKDVVVSALWGLAWVRRDLHWRGNRVRIGPGSSLTRPHDELRPAVVRENPQERS